jgi:hypothetical protein
MRIVLAVLLLAAGGAAALAPFFTDGACQKEFDAVGDLLDRARPNLLALPQAQTYLKEHGLSYEALTPERCAAWHPRDIEVECPGGMLLVGIVPVTNKVCRYYRDRNILFQLGYNARAQLIHVQTDMKPYQILHTPWGSELYIAK